MRSDTDCKVLPHPCNRDEAECRRSAPARPLPHGDARHYVHRVYAETRSKAKYKVFKDLEEVFDSAEAMLCFKVRRAR